MVSVSVDGVRLAYEETGEGFPLVWAHEYGGSLESWRPQVQFFARRYRVIIYNARGYPPSGGGTALRFGLAHPDVARSLIVASAGTGSDDPERFRQEQAERATWLEREGIEALKNYHWGRTRLTLRRKDAIAWREFGEQFLRHSPLGLALTSRGVQARRLPLFAYENDLHALQVPTLILLGDEDEPCLAPGLFLKRHIPRSGLAMFPQSGHAINLEEPELFNRIVLDFLTAVEAGKWPARERE